MFSVRGDVLMLAFPLVAISWHRDLGRMRSAASHLLQFLTVISKYLEFVALLLFLGSALRGACWKIALELGLIDDSRWFACVNSFVSGRHRWRPETSFYVSAGRRQYWNQVRSRNENPTTEYRRFARIWKRFFNNMTRTEWSWTVLCRYALCQHIVGFEFLVEFVADCDTYLC